MSKVKAEFSRPLPVEEIGGGVRRRIEANATELQALAGRMKLPAIRALSAELEVEPQGGGSYLVRGRLTATVDQECVRTLEVFSSEIAEPVERLFVPPGSEAAHALSESPVLELEADADEAPDVIENEAIDLGELVAETLALALDPWPKKPGTDFLDYSTDGEMTETLGESAPRNPFSVLSRLKEK